MSRNLVFEIGTEELPSAAIYRALEQLKTAVPTALDEARLDHGHISVLASPRRLAVLVDELAERQPDATLRHKGPAAKAAFDETGAPTKAAQGFARGKGVDVSALEVVEDEAGSYVYATVELPGADTLDVLPGLLASIAEGLEFAKSQRWGSGETRFARPVRWLLALYGSDIVPVSFAGLQAGRVSSGHRFLGGERVEIADGRDYVAALEYEKVLVDQDARAAAVRGGIDAVASAEGGHAVVPDKTFAEVVNLVEWPTVAAGTFDESFLDVPREILENAMESHQRYFPLERADGSLANRFIVAHNGDSARTDAIIRGHERVIRARLSDAAFFYREDLKVPLEGWLPRLDTVVFQEKLGTLADKSDRIERLAGLLAEKLASSDETAEFARRAGRLAKADLVTSAVVEFTDLQGVMGRYYAEAAGEPSPVASAIEEHYRPRFAGDVLPNTEVGRLVAIADKADTICGIFAAGLAPRGSADPFALRRAAIGIIQMALAGTSLDLRWLVTAALEGYRGTVERLDVDAVATDVLAFFFGRLEGLLRDRGLSYDTVDAVLAGPFGDPADALARCEALAAAREHEPETFENLSIAFKRAANLVTAGEPATPDRALMGSDEIALADALDAAAGRVSALLEQRSYASLLEEYAALRTPIDAFFESVLVMDEDLKLRANRLGLLARFVDLFARFGDFSKLAGQ